MSDLIKSIPPWFYIALAMHAVVLGTVAYLILLERKVASWVQDRIGPNRVGPRGLLQPMADGMKFLFKEEFRPAGVDRALFTIAPMLMIGVVIVSIAVIPWGGIRGGVIRDVQIPAGAVPNDVVRPLIPKGHELIAVSIPDGLGPGEPDILYKQGAVEGTTDRLAASAPQAMTVNVSHGWHFQIANLNIGVLFIIAVLSLAVYGVVVGGWASNNKYSFLGGLRATANMISYEIPLGLSLLAIVVMYGSLDLGIIVERQAHYWAGVIPAWNVFTQPLAFLLFIVCIHAEANRAPFDLAEAEQELVGGYHTEYSSMRFALFFLAEYAGMITTSAVCVALFFGGWHIPWLDKLPAFQPPPGAGRTALTTELWINLLRTAVFFGKTLAIVFVFMWVRWSLPRFRFDQLMNIAWRGMIPVSLALVMGTAVVVYLARGETFVGLKWQHAAMLLGMNVVLIAGMALASMLLPAPPDTNRRMRVAGSRFSEPAPPVAAPAV
jgi:NADH-quinone oxidoreductase subunit H